MQVITNGYDESDLDRMRRPEKGKFRMRYVGNLFSNQNVPALWAAIAELRKEPTDFARDFELELIGKADAAIVDSITAYGLQDCTKFAGFIPHQKAIARMQTASLLLSVIPQVANNKLIITGKIFEYIGAGRPVFLIGPTDSDAAGVIRDSRSGMIHGYEEKDKMKRSLLHYYAEYKSGLTDETAKNIQAYSRKNLTGKLASILDELTARSM
jgi:glycosyltransferase involved in cell wall biosynthesis